MLNLNRLSLLTAGFIVLLAGVFPASAQYRDRDYDRDRDRRGGFSLRLGDDDDDRGWRRRGERCHWEVRRYRDRDGDLVVRRTRVCDDD
jgi:hypothetical protein